MKREPLTPAYIGEIPFSAELVFEPKGIILIVGPWNVPFFLNLYPLISSIAAGNTAFVKPSELTQSSRLQPDHQCNFNRLNRLLMMPQPMVRM